MRSGVGYDSHRFAEGRRLVLGGVEIPHDRGLAGHSDADAVAHAVTDAILGAAALGDIGAHFPNDPKWKDAAPWISPGGGRSSKDIAQVVNVDVTVICESAQAGPHVQTMRSRLAAALRVGVECVWPKEDQRREWAGFGRGEGSRRSLSR